MDATTRLVFVRALFVGCLASVALGANPSDPVEMCRYEDEYSRAHLQPARLDGQPGIAVVFEGTDDLHYYADSSTAPAPGFNLKISASAEGLSFGPAVFPGRKLFYDPAQEKNIEVYVGDFKVFVPFAGSLDRPTEAKVTIAGLACTSQLCLSPFEKTLTATVDPAGMESWPQVTLAAGEQPEKPTDARQSVLPYGTWVYFLLAIVAGISINIMPCVLPVIPLVMARLIEQSKKSSRNRMATGIAFCTGVVLFFAAFALVAAIINVTTGSVLDLNSLFRYPTAVIVLFLAILFFGLVMLDVITPALPSAVTNRQGSTAGVLGTAGMGFFAGVLSTPCSGALLGFVLVWAQTQPLSVSSAAIVLMGVGMALPYGVIVSVPTLLERIPKPGTWMEIFKKSTGFLLFLIAAKLTLAALPKERLLNVLTYGIIFSFCVWMWGKWVGFGTPAGKKWTVRLIALAIALGAGWWLLPAPPEVSIDWREYGRTAVRAATEAGRPVLLKFTADWCGNCKVVERDVFRDREVADLIETRNVLPIKADTTLHDYPATIALKEVYGEAGNVPVTIVVLPDGTRRTLRGIFDKNELIDIIEAIPEQTINGQEEGDTSQTNSQEDYEISNEWFR
ncbi:MAG: thioredoxin family protein [Sedimentisphaerales bacterium]|nr:thioredoxin family protein [Sedimentisphaerales bacterium]